MRFCFFALFLFAFSSSGWAEVRKIVHPDGTVEFTNVPERKSKTKTLTTREKSSKKAVYKYRQEDGVLTYTDLKPGAGIEHEVFRFECFACNPASTVDWHRIALNHSSYAEEVARMAGKYAVDPALVRAVIHAESAFNPEAVSSQGAQGLMQLMPATAKELGVSNALDSAENIEGGTRYLSKLLALYNGDIKLATAAYNAGPGAVKKYGGVPPYSETKTYVKRVGILHARYQKEKS